MPFSFVLFLFSLGAIFISDILPVVNNSYKLSDFIVLFAPFFLFFLAKIEGKKFYLPIKSTILYLLFIVFSIISVFFAIDKEIALNYLFIYISCYFFFVFAYNYKDYLDKYFKKFLVITSLFFILLFSINYLFKLNLFNEGGSLFFNYGHNQIGNFLVVGFTLVFPNLLSLLFLIFIILSYSRTAYLTLILMILIQTFKKKLDKKILLPGVFFVLITLIFFILTSKNILFTQNKKIFGVRDVYFSYALSSIKEKPLFGIGQGNFLSAVSKRQVNWNENTTTAHNFILDILAENGVIAAIFFTLFFISVFKNKRNHYFLAFLVLTLVFMLDFSYRFNLFLILWFVLAGINSDEKQKIIDGKILIFIIVLFTFIFGQINLLTNYYLNSDVSEKSLIFNPCRKEIFRKIIDNRIKEGKIIDAKKYLVRYDKFFGQSAHVILEEAAFYEKINELKKTLSLRNKALKLHPLDMNNLSKILELLKDIKDEEEGKRIFTVLLKSMKQHIIYGKNTDLFRVIDIFCREEKLDCIK